MDDEIKLEQSDHASNSTRRKYQDGYITANGLEIKGFLTDIQKYVCISACICKKDILVDSRFIQTKRFCGSLCPELLPYCTEQGKLGGKIIQDRFSNEDLILTKRFNRIKKDARQKRKIEFQIKKTDYKAIAFLPCVYCGQSDSKRIRGNETVKINGIDRIDSSKGYIMGNIQSCCFTCNMMKGEMIEKVFFEHVVRIYSYRNLGNVVVS